LNSISTQKKLVVKVSLKKIIHVPILKRKEPCEHEGGVNCVKD